MSLCMIHLSLIKEPIQLQNLKPIEKDVNLSLQMIRIFLHAYNHEISLNYNLGVQTYFWNEWDFIDLG